jgi:hypothetical protein
MKHRPALNWLVPLIIILTFITAGVGLIVAGVAILKRAAWAAKTYLVFAGMLIYSVIASPGYFAQQGQWALVIMFAVLLVLAVASVYTIAESERC